jgi:hypothetical protein
LVEDESRLVLFDLDLSPRCEPHAPQLIANSLAELGLRQEQEVVASAAEDEERCDHARLRRQQERFARVPDSEGFDVVREHALEVLGSVGSSNTDERARPLGSNDRHAD